MGSLRFSDYSNSPTLLLPPPSVHAFSSTSYSLPMQHQQACPTPLSAKPQNSCQLRPAVFSAPATANQSRKRTRDESFDESSEALLETPWRAPSVHRVPNKTSENCDPTRPIDSMDITGAMTGDATPSGSQSKAWFGKPADIEFVAAPDAIAPQLVNQVKALAERSRKVRRRDRSSSRELMTCHASNCDGLPKSCPEDPPIDESTHLLGIGWALIRDDRDVQAAARGCARYIENHYPFSMAKIILRSKGLDAVLVETNEGYHLFNEKLSEGKLVSVTWQICLANLQHSPIVFEGLTTLNAVRKNSVHLSETDCGEKSRVDARKSNSLIDCEMSID